MFCWRLTTRSRRKVFTSENDPKNSDESCSIFWRHGDTNARVLWFGAQADGIDRVPA